MQCFICVTYMIILCGAHPVKDKELAVATPQKRSLFHDVIESLRIRSQLPEDINQNDENNLSQNYDRYGYDNEPPHLPSDADFIPRRNDRIEMPSLKYRFPKSLSNETEEKMANVTTEEIVLFIDTDNVPKTTQKPKKQKRPQPAPNKKPPSKNKVNDEQEDEVQTPNTDLPFSNSMSGQSQIGHRESQTVVKPTVIVNFRGTLSHQDSDIRLESRTNNDTADVPQNVFNINQEVNFEPKRDAVHAKKGMTIKGAEVRQEFNIGSENGKNTKVEEDMLMCETATWNPKRNVNEARKLDNVLQILFSV